MQVEWRELASSLRSDVCAAGGVGHTGLCYYHREYHLHSTGIISINISIVVVIVIITTSYFYYC